MKNRLNAPFNAKNRPKKEVDYYTPKRAFAQIMEHYPAESHVDLFGSEEARKSDRKRIKADRRVTAVLDKLVSDFLGDVNEDEISVDRIKARARAKDAVITKLSRSKEVMSSLEMADFFNEAPTKKQGVVTAKGIVTKNPTAPSMTDFKIDVEKQVRKVIRTHDHMVKFIKRYIFDIEDLTKEEQHLFSGFEQRIGRLFIQAKIYPLGKYLISIRKDKATQ